MPDGALGVLLPELHSHSLTPYATVRQVVQRGLDSILAPRLSTTATRQRAWLIANLAKVRISGDHDSRLLPLCGKRGGQLKNSALYDLLHSGGELSEHADFVWSNHAPSKVRFFGWLAVQDRIQCRANLVKKTILRADEGGCPICGAFPETTTHILLDCPFARSFWRDNLQCFDLPSCPLPSSVPARSASTLRLLCFWHLWKHRNGVAFQGLPASVPLARQNCRADAALWRVRLPREHRADVDIWLTYLTPSS
ncbi:unnamed protein product [Alopecurus aequalis]